MNARNRIESTYDAVIVGARVAGASTALLLARAGLRVLVVDRAPTGLDTTSTHALMRPAVMQLHRWGVLDRVTAAGTPAIRSTTFHYGAEAIALAIQEKDGVDALYAPRRTVIDPILAEAAREAGATVIHGASMTGVLRDSGGRVTGVTLTGPDGAVRDVLAGIVIGADGGRSFTAKAVGAETVHEGRNAGAVIYAYQRGVELEGTHWYYGLGTAAGAIPTNDGLYCVFAAMPQRRFAEAGGAAGLDRLFMGVLAETDPELAAKIARSEAVGRLHPFAGRAGFLRQAYGPGWALVGDAGCFKDPITAHGITDALRDAELLANAVIAGTPDAFEAYRETRDGFAAEFVELSDAIAGYDWTLDEAKAMHLRLSRLMGREYELVMSFRGAAAVA